MTSDDVRPEGVGGQPHDALFRRVFGSPEAAASEIASVLPAGVSALLDLAGMEVVAGTFVDEELRHQHADVLFSVPLADGGDERALVYVLMEHQSSPDALMPFRMLKYTVRIWEDALRGRVGGQRLPWVIPLVLYHGSRAWKVPLNVSGLVDVPSRVRAGWPELVPSFGYVLDDLQRVDAEALLARRMAPEAVLSLAVLKFAYRNPDVTVPLLPFVPAFQALLDGPAGREALLSLLTYLRRVSETPDALLRTLMREVGPEAEEAAMSTEQQTLERGIQQGIEQGIERGIERGIEQGIERGIQQGRARMLLDQLTWRFGQPSADVERAVKTASAEQLQLWSMRLVDGADSPESVIGTSAAASAPM